VVEISLRGLTEIASDILAGVYDETSDIFEEAPTEYWDLYDTITPA
jgi:hypothetical protein